MMTKAIKSEFRKLFTTRMWWAMAIGVFLAGALMAGVLAFVFTMDMPMAPGQQGPVIRDDAQLANNVYTAGIGLSYALLLTIGVLSIGQEYRHQTISGTFLAVPNRTKAMLAKVISLLGVGVVYGIIAMIGSVGVGASILSLRGHPAFPDGSVARTLALSLVVLGLWAMIGLGAGILMKNQIVALLVMLGITFIVEPIMTIALSFWEFGAQHLIKWLPGTSSSSALDAVSQSPTVSTLPWWGGILVLAGYAVLLTGIGVVLTRRRDIS